MRGMVKNTIGHGIKFITALILLQAFHLASAVEIEIDNESLEYGVGNLRMIVSSNESAKFNLLIFREFESADVEDLNLTPKNFFEIYLESNDPISIKFLYPYTENLSVMKLENGNWSKISYIVEDKNIAFYQKPLKAVLGFFTKPAEENLTEKAANITKEGKERAVKIENKSLEYKAGNLTMIVSSNKTASFDLLAFSRIEDLEGIRFDSIGIKEAYEVNIESDDPLEIMFLYPFFENMSIKKMVKANWSEIDFTVKGNSAVFYQKPFKGILGFFERVKVEEKPAEEKIGNISCVPVWECSSWSSCISGFVKRTCSDKNNCFADKSEIASCSIVGRSEEVILGVVAIVLLFGIFIGYVVRRR